MPVAGRHSPHTLQSIQVCRGIAALLVVLGHVSGCVAAQKYFGEPAFNYLFHSGGLIGVGFFFVLSGFIITSVHWGDVNKPSRFPSYLYKRFVRIYPTYWLVFLVALLGMFAVPGANDGVPKDLGTVLKAAALLPQEPGIGWGAKAPVLAVAWTLQYEMLFYTFFGLLILNRIAALAFAACVIGSAVAGHALGWHLPLHFLHPVYFVLFGGGLVTGLAVKAKLWSSHARIAAFLGAAALVAAAVMEGQPEPDLICGFGASLLIFGLATIESVRQFKISRGWLLLGNASYVLYLTHFPIVIMACKIAKAVGLAGFVAAAITWGVTLALCIGIAVLIHVKIEIPMMAATRAFIERFADARKVASAKQAPAI